MMTRHRTGKSKQAINNSSAENYELAPPPKIGKTKSKRRELTSIDLSPGILPYSENKISPIRQTKNDLGKNSNLKTPVPSPEHKLLTDEPSPHTPVAQSPDYNLIYKTPETPVEYPPPTPRKESQAHGLTWEKDILHNSFKVPLCILDDRKKNSEFDLEAKYNKLDEDVNLSVKVSGSNTINMGDCRRVYKQVASGIPIHLIVIQYKQVGNKKKIVRITEFDLTGAKELLFGDITIEDLEKLDKAIKSLPRCSTPKSTNKRSLRFMRDDIYSQRTIRKSIRLNIKCTKEQRRLQFSIQNWAKFVADNRERVVLESKTNKFRKGYIRPELISEPRKRKEKISTKILQQSNIEFMPGTSIDIVSD
jgi:hypothetical protein